MDPYNSWNPPVSGNPLYDGTASGFPVPNRAPPPPPYYPSQPPPSAPAPPPQYAAPFAEYPPHQPPPLTNGYSYSQFPVPAPEYPPSYPQYAPPNPSYPPPAYPSYSYPSYPPATFAAPSQPQPHPHMLANSSTSTPQSSYASFSSLPGYSIPAPPTASSSFLPAALSSTAPPFSASSITPLYQQPPQSNYSMSSLSQSASDPVFRISVHVGIVYRGGRSELRGCGNDIIEFMRVLRERYGFHESIVLSDDPTVATVHPGVRHPTGANIRAAMREVVHKLEIAKSQGRIPFVMWHYSGHGTRIRDDNGDEDDGFDEAFCPVDSDRNGVIRDDEFFRDFVARIPESALGLFLMDCCHSGTIADLPFTSTATGQCTRVNNNVVGAQIFMISGCRDNQTSADTYDPVRAKNIGALTNAFIEVIQTAPAGTMHAILEQIRAVLQRRRLEQYPVLSSSRPIQPQDKFPFEELRLAGSSI